MTKEELYETFRYWFDVDGERNVSVKLDEFFDSNICIPKGTNRHPYADVLHKWVEGAEVEYNTILNYSHIPWRRLVPYDGIGHIYRIKPQEPVYEYQYACVDVDGKGYISGYYGGNDPIPCDGILLEGTKRERK